MQLLMNEGVAVKAKQVLAAWAPRHDARAAAAAYCCRWCCRRRSPPLAAAARLLLLLPQGEVAAIAVWPSLCKGWRRCVWLRAAAALRMKQEGEVSESASQGSTNGQWRSRRLASWRLSWRAQRAALAQTQLSAAQHSTAQHAHKLMMACIHPTWLVATSSAGTSLNGLTGKRWW